MEEAGFVATCCQRNDEVRPLDALPEEMKMHLLGFLDAKALCWMEQLSKDWHQRVERNDHLWLRLCCWRWSGHCRDSNHGCPPLLLAPSKTKDRTRSVVERSAEEALRHQKELCKEYRHATWKTIFKYSHICESNWNSMNFVEKEWHHNSEAFAGHKQSKHDDKSESEESESESESDYEEDPAAVTGVYVERNRIFSVGVDSAVNVYDMHGRQLHRLTESWNWNRIGCIDFDGDLLAVGYMDEPVSTKTHVVVWDLNTGKPVHRLKGHQQSVMALVLQASRLVTSGSSDLSIKSWDLNTGQEALHIDVKEPVSALCLHPSDDNLLIAGSDLSHKIRIWDLRSASCVSKLALADNGDPNFVCKDDKLLVGEAFSGNVWLWDLHSFRPLHQISAPGVSCGKDFNDQFMLLLGEDEVIRLYSMQDGSCVKRYQAKQRMNYAMMDDSSCLLGGLNGSICHIDLSAIGRAASCVGEENLDEAEEAHMISGVESDDVEGLAFCRRAVVAAFSHGLIRLYDFAPFF